MPHTQSAQKDKSRSLRQLTVGACLVLVAITGTIYWALKTSYESYNERARLAATSLAQTVSLGTETEIRLIDNLLSSVIQAINRAELHGRGGVESVRMITADQRRLIPQVDELQVTDSSGLVINSKGAGSVSVADRDYFLRAKQQRGELIISEPQQGGAPERWGIVLAKARVTSDGRFLGVVFALVPAAHFIDLFDDIKLSKRSSISLRSDTLRLVARYTPETAGHEAGFGSSNVSKEFLDAIAQSPSGGVFASRTALDGVERVSAFQKVYKHSLLVLVGLDAEDYFSAWRRVAFQLVGMGTAAAVLVVAVILLIGRRQRDLLLSRSKLNQLAAEQQLMLDNDLVGIGKFDNRIFTWHNRALASIFGYEPMELVGQPSRVIYLDDESHARVGDCYSRLRANEAVRLELPMKRKDGSTVWIDLSGVQLPDGLSMWVMVDISQVRKREAQATHLASHDPLTGLNNRATLDASLRTAVVNAANSSALLAVAFIDLDGFKTVNDTYGHDVGDELLVAVARRLEGCIRGDDIAARQGGDEFVVVLTDIDGRDQVEQILSRMQKALSEPVHVSSGVIVQVGASVGVSIFPEDGITKEALLGRADQAMYAAKRLRKGRIAFASDQPCSLNSDGGLGATPLA